MKPGSFDLTTAREMIRDNAVRVIEAKSRKDADAETFDPPIVAGTTYFDMVQAEMRIIIYREQYAKRIARSARKLEGLKNA